jgi:hypothetical protein
MAEAGPTLHVVFSPSAAGELHRALKASGRDGPVISLFDCLSFGPINSPDPAARSKWVEEELDYEWWDVVIESMGFWEQPRKHRGPIVVWMSRRSAQEYAGFLEWLWRFGDLSFEIVDLTTVTVDHKDTDGVVAPKLAVSLALLNSRVIIESGLLDRSQKLTTEARQHYRALWNKLRNENAPLRVLVTEEMVSAPISFFDSLLLSYSTRQWQKAALIVGHAMAQDFLETQMIQTGDLLLAARLRSLVAAGLLESRGDLSLRLGGEVRKL